MYLTKLAQTFVFGRLTAKHLAKDDSGNGWTKIWRDMLKLSARYGISYAQYSSYRIHKLSGNDYRDKCKELSVINREQAEWDKVYRSNWRFLAKWTKEKYSGRPYLSYMRGKAYQKHYHLDNYPMVQYGVHILCEHSLKGELRIGKNVLLAKECFIDYTGNVTIEDNVQITFGAIIQTHYHPWHSDYRNEHSTEQTSIVIREGAVVGSKAIVMASCHYIGKHARVGAGAVVTHDVPDYAVVVGSPAKVVRIQEH